MFINRSVQIPVLASYLDISLIHPPTVTNLLLSFVHIPLNHRTELEHLSLNSRMVYFYASYPQYFFHISVTQSKSQFEINCLKNNCLWIAMVFVVHCRKLTILHFDQINATEPRCVPFDHC